MIALVLTLAAVALAARQAGAERATPAEATVFIRIVGQVQAFAGGDPRLRREVGELDAVEVGTGSGFILSPSGYVLTNHHVISGRTFTREVRGEQVEFQINVRRIYVVLPGHGDAARAGASGQFEASVVASDPDLDLAVLYISGPAFPYLALGDSDGLEAGQAIQVLGYPFGRILEVGKATPSDIAPAVTTSPGAISALRTGEDGDSRYLQTTATLNPGNSGGPMVDADGYAVGVVRMKLTNAEGIGFAVPVNLAKKFLAAHGLVDQLPVRLLAPGPPYAPERKGLTLMVPAGLLDASPSRLQVDTAGAADEVTLRIDRVLSPWSLRQLEQALLPGSAFERFVSREDLPRDASGRPRLRGHARGYGGGSRDPMVMEYTLLDLGPEKLIARYLGPADAVAASRSVLRASLASLEGRPLLRPEADRPGDDAWVAADLGGAAPPIPVPAGWIVEPGGPVGCPGAPLATMGLAASPLGDFSISVRLGWWPAYAGGFDALTAGCAADARAADRYASRLEWFGISYVVEGRLIRLGRDVAQVELVAPPDKMTLVQRVFAGWTERLSSLK